tara:strand:- start:1462 stop:2691 length:1230 start_codon:yes stop_codon:yes gene_type:complete
MINYKKALTGLKKNKIIVNSEEVTVENSINRIVDKNIKSPSNHPSSNNTALDGFAINNKDTFNIKKKLFKSFKIIKRIAAGDNPKINKSSKNTAVEVMTGALIPKPYNTIIPFEEIKYSSDKKFILINKKIKKNKHIRIHGTDFKKGNIIIKKGEIITPQHILAFKTLGIKNIKVKKKIRITIFSTGNEVTNNLKIPNWKVRNSNIYYLKALTKNLPIIIKEEKILRDDQSKKFQNKIKKNILSQDNIILTIGALSAGKFDFVPKIIKGLRPKYYFKGCYIRPGKPVMFAKLKNNNIFFGLPGNSISTAATFRFFLLPFIFYSVGAKIANPIKAKLSNNFIKDISFTRFVKGNLIYKKNGVIEFTINKGQESFKIKSFIESNAWGLLPNGKSKFKKGDIIDCHTLTGIN